MALTVDNKRRSVHGDQVVIFADVTFDTSYPTGGEAIAASDFGSDFNQLDEVTIASQDDVWAHQVVYDYANGKLKVYTADGTEQGNGTDASAVKVRIIAYGK